MRMPIPRNETLNGLNLDSGFPLRGNRLCETAQNLTQNEEGWFICCYLGKYFYLVEYRIVCRWFGLAMGARDVLGRIFFRAFSYFYQSHRATPMCL